MFTTVIPLPLPQSSQVRMMNKFFSYFVCQLKRTAKGGLATLTVCIIIAIALIFAVKGFVSAQTAEDAEMVLTIGIVGDMEDNFLSLGVYALQNLDSSSIYVDFIVLEEKEASEKLWDGSLTGYVLIPEGFTESIMTGENYPLTFVSKANPATLGPKLINRMIEIVATYISESQCGIYGTDEYSYKLGEYFDYNDLSALNFNYISKLIQRDTAFDINVVESPDGLSLAAYYTSAIALLLIMLIGITCAPMFSKRSLSLSRLLKSNGLGEVSQTLCEYSAFVLLVFICASVIISALGIYVCETELSVKGLEYLTSGDVLLFALRLLPACILICAMQFLIYELSDNLLAAVTMQFICAISLAYITGCFFPSYFFPEAVRALAARLPSGMAFNYIASFFSPADANIFVMLAFSAVMLALNVFVRKLKIKGGKV